ncbi:hypothetical protein EMCRGX_G006642 [Ephydatia muelleri]
MGKPRVAIVGAGIMGLSIGTLLSDTHGRELDITIVADKFTPDTTSDKSGGQILPYIPASGKVDPSLEKSIVRWASATVRYLQELSQDPAIAEAIHLAKVTGYRLLGAKAPPLPFWRDAVLEFKELGERELAGLKVRVAPKYKRAWMYQTFMLECPSYLPWLMERFRRNGGLIERKKVSSLSEFDGYDVVVNCTGLGARDLVGDTSIYPIRGQILALKGVSLDEIYENDKDTDPAMVYIFPWKDEVIIGGTADANDWSTESNPQTTREIYARCTEAVPKLAEGKVVRTWAGLRPMRSTVRLEMEKRQGCGPAVIHCYGHGGQGVTLHWGCALDVAKLVETALQLTPAKAKL